MKVTLDQLASALAREVRNYGSCRQRIHDDGVCGCGHCVSLRMYDLHVAQKAIVQTPQSAAELTGDI